MVLYRSHVECNRLRMAVGTRIRYYFQASRGGRQRTEKIETATKQEYLLRIIIK